MISTTSCTETNTSDEAPRNESDENGNSIDPLAIRRALAHDSGVPASQRFRLLAHLFRTHLAPVSFKYLALRRLQASDAESAPEIGILQTKLKKTSPKPHSMSYWESERKDEMNPVQTN
jgi:hypothetical protein